MTKNTDRVMGSTPRPVCLVILDGFGVAESGPANSVTNANTPNYDSYLEHYPNTTLSAAGKDVGLPEGQMGNSEVGHLNIGAGRIVHQDLSRITRAIEDKSFFSNDILVKAIDKAKNTGSALHLMGLVSDGGVHSHNSHIYALLKLAKERGLDRVFVHCFLDGRDTPPKSALTFLGELENQTRSIGVGEIATVAGRYYAMDRDHRWDRVKKAYDAMVHGNGNQANSAAEAVEISYREEKADEFVAPTIIGPRGGHRIGDGDSVVFFNFRADRARQLTDALTNPEFDAFDRGPSPPKVNLVCMTLYDIEFDLDVAFPPEELANTLAVALAKNGLRQLHIAETEKYAHVTFFFNGGVEKPVRGEDRILVPSPKVATYDLQPEMSAPKVADKVVEAIGSEQYDFIVVNFANPDMVGHTGKMEASTKAVETVDQVLGRVVRKVKKVGGAALITSDHGNCELMSEADGSPRTAHTDNLVPLIYINDTGGNLRPGKRLADIAPTILSILNVPVPPEISGENLLIAP